MYRMVKVTEDIATEFFFSDPKLVTLSIGDLDMSHMCETKRYVLAEGSVYLGIAEEDGAMVAIIKYECMTNICINFHMYIHSGFHHTHKVREITEFIKDKFRESEIVKAVIMVPSPCEHVHTFAPKYGWELQGRITKCIIWRGQLVDLIIYGLDLGPNTDFKKEGK